MSRRVLSSILMAAGVGAVGTGAVLAFGLGVGLVVGGGLLVAVSLLLGWDA